MIDPIQTSDITMRAEVAQFAIDMEKQLRKNEWKGGWQNETIVYLLHQFQLKANEVNESLNYLVNVSDSIVAHEVVLEDITDAANYLMMLADKLRCSIQRLKGDPNGAC